LIKRLQAIYRKAKHQRSCIELTISVSITELQSLCDISRIRWYTCW